MNVVILTLALTGLAMGSFVNALVWRLHRQYEREHQPAIRRWLRLDWLRRKPHDDYSILHGRSMCPHCRHRLSAADLVPVLSWLWLGGKCRYCKKPISPQYPLVEAAAGLAFVLSYLLWPQPLGTWYQQADFVLWLAALVGLTALFVYDLRWYMLPDVIVWPLVGLALVDVALQLAAAAGAAEVLNLLQYYALGLLPIAGLYWLLHRFSGGRLVGLGDVKLGIFIGLSLGWPGALLALFLSNLLGSLLVLPGIALGRLGRTSRIPFGPFLIAAYVVAGLAGEAIIGWYLSVLGIA